MNQADKSSGGNTIWIVDDDSYILKLFGFLLSKHRISNRCFESAEELLAAPWDDSVGCVITDLRLPGKNGDELCELLKKSHPGLQIILVTTQVTPEGRKAFTAIGFDNVFLKPFTEEELLTLLNGQESELRFPLLDALIEDESEKAEILQQFTEETTHDLILLKEHIRKKGVEQTTLIVHRLAGRLAQFSQEELSAALREMEHSLRTDPQLARHSDELQRLQVEIEAFLDKIPLANR